MDVIRIAISISIIHLGNAIIDFTYIITTYRFTVGFSSDSNVPQKELKWGIVGHVILVAV